MPLSEPPGFLEQEKARATGELRQSLTRQQMMDQYWAKTHPGTVTPGVPATGWKPDAWPTPAKDPLGDLGRGAAGVFNQFLGVLPAKGQPRREAIEPEDARGADTSDLPRPPGSDHGSAY